MSLIWKEKTKGFLPKLNELDADFKLYHFFGIDLVDQERLDTEQATLDNHDDRVAGLTTHIQQLISKSLSNSSSTMESTPQRNLAK